MAKRDPIKTARNKEIDEITEKLRALEPQVLADTGYGKLSVLDAKIGGKIGEFIDLKHEVIHSADHFTARYLEGFEDELSNEWLVFAHHEDLAHKLRSSEAFGEYLMLFLKRAYLRKYEELSKNRPKVDEAEFWIGQERASYGLLVTPRFKDGEWENDKSHIRKVKYRYWSIGHLLEAGLVIPHKESVTRFSDVEQYLQFFVYTLVRGSGSPHELAIAERYANFVRAADNPEDVQLLIHELRYDGLAPKHKYRLDFCVVNPFEFSKVGMELSPWSTHGYLQKTKQLTQAQVNALASDSFAKEMKKHRSFFLKYGITALIYPDDSLSNIDGVFDDIKRYLIPTNQGVQTNFHILRNFLKPKKAAKKKGA